MLRRLNTVWYPLIALEEQVQTLARTAFSSTVREADGFSAESSIVTATCWSRRSPPRPADSV